MIVDAHVEPERLEHPRAVGAIGGRERGLGDPAAEHVDRRVAQPRQIALGPARQHRSSSGLPSRSSASRMNCSALPCGRRFSQYDDIT
jgi:hypothetical protein